MTFDDDNPSNLEERIKILDKKIEELTNQYYAESDSNAQKRLEIELNNFKNERKILFKTLSIQLQEESNFEKDFDDNIDYDSHFVSDEEFWDNFEQDAKEEVMAHQSRENLKFAHIKEEIVLILSGFPMHIREEESLMYDFLDNHQEQWESIWGETFAECDSETEISSIEFAIDWYKQLNPQKKKSNDFFRKVADKRIFKELLCLFLGAYSTDGPMPAFIDKINERGEGWLVNPPNMVSIVGSNVKNKIIYCFNSSATDLASSIEDKIEKNPFTKNFGYKTNHGNSISGPTIVVKNSDNSFDYDLETTDLTVIDLMYEYPKLFFMIGSLDDMVNTATIQILTTIMFTNERIDQEAFMTDMKYIEKYLGEILDWYGHKLAELNSSTSNNTEHLIEMIITDYESIKEKSENLFDSNSSINNLAVEAANYFDNGGLKPYIMDKFYGLSAISIPELEEELWGKSYLEKMEEGERDREDPYWNKKLKHADLVESTNKLDPEGKLYDNYNDDDWEIEMRDDHDDPDKGQFEVALAKKKNKRGKK